MLDRLIRILMACAVALVFAGETASAGGPCLAMEQAAAEAPCHEMAGMEMPAKKVPAKTGCECVALLKCSMATPVVLASAVVEPWAWGAPEGVEFSSFELAPDGHPPKG